MDGITESWRMDRTRRTQIGRHAIVALNQLGARLRELSLTRGLPTARTRKENLNDEWHSQSGSVSTAFVFAELLNTSVTFSPSLWIARPRAQIDWGDRLCL